MNAFDPDTGWSHWPAPAKLNLFLRITGRRADGYHELQTVFRLLDWGDRIRLRVREDGQIRRHGASVEAPRSNAASSCARSATCCTGCRRTASTMRSSSCSHA